MKKLIVFVTSLFILLSMAVPTFAADDLPYVVDDADLLSVSEETELEANLSKLSQDNNFDIVVLTVDSLDGKTAEEYADDYYDYTGYGYGSNRDGCLFLINMEEREWHLSTRGFGVVAITDAGIDYIGNKMLSSLSSGDYYDAFLTYGNIVTDFVLKANSGNVYDYNNLDEYDSSYDSDYKHNDDSSEGSIGTAIIAGLVAGAIIAAIFISVLKGKMKTVYHKAQANDYLVNGSLTLTGQHDIFVTSHITKTPRESKSSGGGSSTHTSSSGASHGGGGGHF